MSALPKAVQAQLDQAEALQAQLASPAPVETENPVEVVEPKEEPLQPAQPVVQETQATPVVPDETWEQRFRIMEGKFKAEVPRLYEQNRDLAERLEHALSALEEKEVKQSKQDTKLVVDADVEAFGADLIDMVRRAAREEFTGMYSTLLEDLDARFGKVTEKVKQTEQEVAKSATEKFWDSVLEKHSDFDTVNNDPRWFAFLDVRVPGARFTRRALAENAIEAKDAVALNEQLSLFKESIAKPATTAKPKPSLNSQVAPNTSSASTPVADTPTGKVWTGQEYAAALDHRNLQRMTREEYEALVNEAETAFAEGRVRF